jgi:hypothetical protein
MKDDASLVIVDAEIVGIPETPRRNADDLKRAGVVATG